MTGWNFIFILTGVATLTAQLFQVIDLIDGHRL